LLDKIFAFFGYAVCHCLPSRTLTVGGAYLPVCARCAGVYAGIATTYVFLVTRRGFKINALPSFGVSLGVAALLLPMAADGLSSYLGLRATTNVVRFATGLAGGAALPVFAFPLLSPELVMGEGKKKAVRPFGRWFDYPAWLGLAAAVGAFVLRAPAWAYYPLAAFIIAGLVAIFFNLSLVIWEMILERAGRWGRRPWTLVPAALTVALVFSLLNVLHYYSFRAMMSVSGGELPP
jgi:uncharacterized membrane protein